MKKQTINRTIAKAINTPISSLSLRQLCRQRVYPLSSSHSTQQQVKFHALQLVHPYSADSAEQRSEQTDKRSRKIVIILIIIMMYYRLMDQQISQQQIEMKNKNQMYVHSGCSEQFSFSKGLEYDNSEKSSANLKNDLYMLEKVEIIDLLMEQIQENKVLKYKALSLEEELKLISSFRDQSIDSSLRFRQPLAQQNNNHYNQVNKQFGQNSHNKYKQLTLYMEQYINNTNQIQNQMIKSIQNLRKENSLKNQEIRNLKLQRPSSNQNHQIVKKLQDSLSHYIYINNENTNKYEKLKKMYEVKEEELQNTINSCKCKQMITPTQQQSNNQKILQIMNMELKESIKQLESVLQKKSEKIRHLLEEMQKLSQERWHYKEMYMQIKAKSKVTETMSVKDSLYMNQSGSGEFNGSKN